MKNESQMMRGEDWDGSPVAGMYASRKLNGVSCLWDGAEAWTRSGNRIDLPANIRATLPAIQLDCEIISGDGENSDFNAASLAVRLNKWTPACRAVAFDAPTMPGDWRRRIEAAREAGAPCVYYTAVVDSGDLMNLFEKVTKAGGEGLMLRAPGVDYRPGRIRDVLKVKWCQAICEAMNLAGSI